MNVTIVFWQMLSMLLLLLVGVFSYRRGYVSATNTKPISNLIANIFNPAMVLSSVMGAELIDSHQSVRIVWIIAVTMFAFHIGFSFLTKGIFSKDRDEQINYQLMTVFTNFGYIGLPIVRAVFGPEKGVYVAVYILLFNLLVYTYGIALLQKEKQSLMTNIKQTLNIGTVSSVLALLIFMLGIPVHPVLQQTVTYLGGVATPLALMTIGFSLGQMNLSEIFLSKKVYLFASYKMLLLPVIEVLILKQFNLPADVLGVCGLMCAMPVGNLPTILAYQHGINADISSKSIVVTTMISVVTIPLIAALI